MAKVKRKRKSKTKPKAKTPVWDMDRDGVTQSFLHKFLTCREATRLAFVEGWTKQENGLPIEFGSCFHWVISEMIRAKKFDARSGHKFCGKYMDVWRAERGPGPVPQTTQAMMEKVLGMNEVLIPHYLQRWESDWTGKRKAQDRGFVVPKRWIATEERFQVPYKLGEREIKLNGCFDGVFEDAKGKLWLIERKTKGQIDEGAIVEGLPVDIQVHFYLRALEIWLGKRPAGVVYDVVRRPGQRQGKTEKLVNLLERMSQDIEKRPDHYFIRWQFKPTRTELSWMDKNFLAPVLRQVARWWDNLEDETFVNPDALYGRYGRSDMFNPIVNGDFSGHYQRSKAFSELEDV